MDFHANDDFPVAGGALDQICGFDGDVHGRLGSSGVRRRGFTAKSGEIIEYFFAGDGFRAALARFVETMPHPCKLSPRGRRSNRPPAPAILVPERMKLAAIRANTARPLNSLPPAACES